MVSVTVLASGSKGNCTLVASATTRLLVDAGLSCREILRRLVLSGEEPGSLDAVLITPGRPGHVAGLLRLARKLKFPIYISAATCAEYQRVVRDSLGQRVTIERRECFRPGESFQIGDISVLPFTIPHDAVDPVGFTFR